MKRNDRASNNCSLNVIFKAELETSERTKEKILTISIHHNQIFFN